MSRERLANLMDEANQLVAIAVASINTARRKLKTEVRNPQSAIHNQNESRHRGGFDQYGLAEDGDGSSKSAIRNPQSEIE